MINFCSLLYSGDKEKELWPHSDYRSMFLGEQLGKRDVLQPFDKIAGPPTIRGDARTHHLGHFTTTTKSEFVGRYLPRHQLLDSSLRVRKEISNKWLCVIELITNRWAWELRCLIGLKGAWALQVKAGRYPWQPHEWEPPCRQMLTGTVTLKPDQWKIAYLTQTMTKNV